LPQSKVDEIGAREKLLQFDFWKRPGFGRYRARSPVRLVSFSGTESHRLLNQAEDPPIEMHVIGQKEIPGELRWFVGDRRCVGTTMRRRTALWLILRGNLLQNVVVDDEQLLDIAHALRQVVERLLERGRAV
jgi:hypothetical protein